MIFFLFQSYDPIKNGELECKFSNYNDLKFKFNEKKLLFLSGKNSSTGNNVGMEFQPRHKKSTAESQEVSLILNRDF